MTLDYFPFYYDAWMKSEMRAILPTPARAIFVEIFLRCCAEGSVPMDHDALIGIGKCTPKEFIKAWPLFKRALVERDGRYVNLKAIEVRQGVANKVKGGQARHKNKSADVQQNVSTTPAEPQQEDGRTSAEGLQSESRKQKAESRKASHPSVVEVLRRLGWPDGRLAPDSIQRLVDRCREATPDVTDAEIAYFAGVAAESIGRSAKDPMAVLITQLPEWLSKGLNGHRVAAEKAEKRDAKLRAFNAEQRILTLRELAASDGTESWCVEGRENAIRELREMGLEP